MSANTTEIAAVDPGLIVFEAGSEKPTVPPSATLDNLYKAVEILQKHAQPVAFPTETVYGLGASALSTEAVQAIYLAKNRPADNPLIVHVSGVDQLERLLLPRGTHVPEIYHPLIEKFWPGPLTILLPVSESCPISTACTVGQSTFAVRVPQHPVARALIALADLPLAAPSANASTRPSPTTAQHVFTDLNGKIPLILDGGNSEVGVESTVVDGLSDPPMLLRPGGVSIEDIKKYGGPAWANIGVANPNATGDQIVRTPGMKYKHYSPRSPVVLFQNCGDGLDEVVGYLSTIEPQPKKVGLLRTRKFTEDLVKVLGNSYEVEDLPLGTTGADISRNLFSSLRTQDDEDVDVIVVEGIDESDEGLAVMNRLRKAASTLITG